jgi:hypothetical protein
VLASCCVATSLLSRLLTSEDPELVGRMDMV